MLILTAYISLEIIVSLQVLRKQTHYDSFLY